MAAVYQAQDRKRQTMCAIKEMSLASVPVEERSQAIQNFLAEATILSRLNHPNLPAFTDFFTEDSRHFLVMEYVEGQTLEELLDIRGGPFSERQVLGWARQLCDVLEYLHSQQPPVIFRDMKPGNIMLMRNGRIKLIDFGIARLFRQSSAQDTQTLGTPGFAPPEQYGIAQTDERSDIYSLAMTLFQLMTNTLPETGFGLQNIHSTHPNISPAVAHALEKATSLKPEERYESIVVFRRALLGVGTFLFENGSEATTPEELAELCARFPEEAEDYLYQGEIELWLQEIGAHELERATRRIRTTVGDPELGVEKFLQVVMGPSAHTRSYPTVPTTPSGLTGNGTFPGARIGPPGWRRREPSSLVVVRPKTIDFGQVYPGLSAPMLLTISGEKGAYVSGTISTDESWIITDLASFDGMSTQVRVRVDSTRLPGSTHYAGTIVVTDDETEQEIPVRVEVDVLGFAQTTSGRSRAGQTGYSQAMPLPDEEDEDEVDQLTMGTMNRPLQSASAMRMAPALSTGKGTAIPQASQAYTSPKDSEYKAKYGQPGSGGWDPLQTAPRQRGWMKQGLTFSAAFMAACFCYIVLSRLPALVHTSLLPPHAGFAGVLLAAIPLATLGAVLVGWNSTWGLREIINRMCSSLMIALLAAGLSESIWQNLSLPQNAPLQMFMILFAIALGATIGIQARVSLQLFRIITWAMRRLRMVMIALAVVIGGALGFGLTMGFAFSWLVPVCLLLGIAVTVGLVLRAEYLMKHP